MLLHAALPIELPSTATRRTGALYPNKSVTLIVNPPPLAVATTFTNFQAGSQTFTAVIAANNPVLNFFSNVTTAPPNASAIYSSPFSLPGVNPCQGTSASNSVCSAFLNAYVSYVGGNCAPFASNSTAQLSDQKTSMTFTIVCGSTGSVSHGDTLKLSANSNLFESAYPDPNNPGSNQSLVFNTSANLAQIAAP